MPSILARAARKPSASGFVNAVLRSTLRQRAPPAAAARDPTIPRIARQSIQYLGLTQSHPDWLVARWLDRYGFDATERWVRFNNEAPLLTLRGNRLRMTREALQSALDAEGIETEPRSTHRTACSSPREIRSGMSPAASFVVQDEASQLVPLIVGARSGETILDLCASPGGKTTAMAADMDDTGTPRRI